MRRAILLFILIAVSACVQSDQYTEQYNIQRVAITGSDEECKIGECWCMVCTNDTSIFSRTNLMGEKCYMEKECNRTTFEALAKNDVTPDLSIRNFMIGQGPTIADFAQANTYCANSLRMAVEFLVGDADTAYELPDPQRSMCLLSKDVIPVYVMYSKGENINASRAGEIGTILATKGDDLLGGGWSDGPVGPSIVVTEIDFNRSDVDQVAEQVRRASEACTDNDGNKSCWVAVAPRVNDFDALDDIMRRVGGQVDIIAFGVNGKYMNLSKGTGSIGTAGAGAMMNQVVNFTEYALYNWSRPVLIPYIMFDRGTTDLGGAEWTESDVVAAYSAFWPFGVQELQQKGVIGVAPYSFNSTSYGSVSNPLNCNDCAVGSSPDRLNAWYGYCDKYASVPGTGGLPTTGAGTPIVFRNESGGTCNFNAVGDYFWHIGFGDTVASGDILSRQNPEAVQRSNVTFRCSSCLLQNVSTNARLPFSSTLEPNSGFDPYWCTAFPEIEYWADSRNLDPMLVRAFILGESDHFAPDSAARVCAAGYTGTGPDGRPCFDGDPAQDECYNIAYSEMHNPGSPDYPENRYDGIFENAPNSDEPDPDWKWCGIGLMQSLEPPYTFWPAEYFPGDANNEPGTDGPYYYIAENAGIFDEDLIPVAAACASDVEGRFNPFNVSHALCMGTYKMAKNLQQARQWIRDNSDQIGGFSEEDENILAAYLSAVMYGGYWGAGTRDSNHPRCAASLTNGDCWAQGFALSREITEEYCEQVGDDGEPVEGCSDFGEVDFPGDPPEKCYGYQDFVAYIKDCEMPYILYHRI